LSASPGLSFGQDDFAKPTVGGLAQGAQQAQMRRVRTGPTTGAEMLKDGRPVSRYGGIARNQKKVPGGFPLQVKGGKNYYVTDSNVYRLKNIAKAQGQDEPQLGDVTTVQEENGIGILYENVGDSLYRSIPTATEVDAIVKRDPPPPPPPVRSSDPLVFDLDGDGIALGGPSAGIKFDVDADGTAEFTGWPVATVSVTNGRKRIKMDDALLVADWNNNGQIDNGTELFGMTPKNTGFENGFKVLASHDGDADGKKDDQITPADKVYGKLHFWLDKNGNAQSERDELFPIANLGVTVISLKYDDAYDHVDVHGNRIREHSVFRRRVIRNDDGTPMELESSVVNIWFGSVIGPTL